MPIYTRTGDLGETSLFGGKRVLKSEPLVDVYGSIDELNSWVGVTISNFQFSIFNKKSTKSENEIAHFLMCIQEDLFTIGSVFAGWREGDLSQLVKRAKEMEERIDRMEKDLSPLANFILPGGSSHGASVHVTRSVCRRVERQVVGYCRSTKVDDRFQEGDKEAILMYLNRLSDLFFVLARFINKKENVEEMVWSGIVKEKK